ALVMTVWRSPSSPMKRGAVARVAPRSLRAKGQGKEGQRPVAVGKGEGFTGRGVETGQARWRAAAKPVYRCKERWLRTAWVSAVLVPTMRQRCLARVMAV